MKIIEVGKKPGYYCVPMTEERVEQLLGKLTPDELDKTNDT